MDERASADPAGHAPVLLVQVGATHPDASCADRRECAGREKMTGVQREGDVQGEAESRFPAVGGEAPSAS